MQCHFDSPISVTRWKRTALAARLMYCFQCLTEGIVENKSPVYLARVLLSFSKLSSSGNGINLPGQQNNFPTRSFLAFNAICTTILVFIYSPQLLNTQKLTIPTHRSAQASYVPTGLLACSAALLLSLSSLTPAVYPR